MGPLRFTLTALTHVAMPGQLLVLGLMLGCGVWAAARRGVLPLIALAVCTAVWLRANSQLEGAVLVSFTREHGLTLADLLVPALGSAVLLFRLTTHPKPDEPRPAGSARASQAVESVQAR